MIFYCWSTPVLSLFRVQKRKLIHYKETWSELCELWRDSRVLHCLTCKKKLIWSKKKFKYWWKAGLISISSTILVCVWEHGWNRVFYKFEFFKKLFFLYFWCIDVKNIF